MGDDQKNMETMNIIKAIDMKHIQVIACSKIGLAVFWKVHATSYDECRSLAKVQCDHKGLKLESVIELTDYPYNSFSPC